MVILPASVISSNRTLTVYYAEKQLWQQLRFNEMSSVSHPASQVDNSFLIDGLTSCDSYCFASQLTWPARSPLVQPSPPCFTTPDDPNAPPKNVKIYVAIPSAESLSTEVNIKWEPPCHPIQMAYVVEVIDELGYTEGFPVSDPSGTQAVIWIKITNLMRGGNYTFVVRRDEQGARKSPAIAQVIAPFSAPTEFKALTDLYSERGMFKLEWTHPRDVPGGVVKTYEIYWSTDYVKKGVEATFKFYSATTELLLVIEDLEYDKDHSFKVRIVATSGYPGLFSDVETVYAPSNAKELELRYPHGRDNPARSSLLWLLVLAGAIVLLLSIALAVYVIRHRRLQRSFTSFANSHYDNRRGTTTFGTNDLEVDDQPMIRCFADDEPLIVA
jgi:hypothetical protein